MIISVIIFDQSGAHSVKKVYAKRENVHAFIQHILSYLQNLLVMLPHSFNCGR